MEFKHFSHPHALSFHRTPQTTEAICSGCKSPVSFGSVYSCWQCNFFLHEQCYNAGRSMDHPSHPSHPLSLFPYPTYPSGSFFCNCCNLAGIGFSYSCSSCEFDLHVHCAYMPVNTNHDPYPSLPNQTHSLSQETASYNPQYAYNTPENTAYGNVFAGLTPQYNFPSETVPSLNAPRGQPGQAVSTNQPPHLPPYTSKHYPPNPVSNNNFQNSNLQADLPHPRYLKHFSHHHALGFSEVEEEDNILCSGCEQHLSGSACRCNKPKCDFQLHKSCFELPREIPHKSHPQHALVLLSSPPYESGEFTCDACTLTGTAFDYHCNICQFDLHVKCATLSENMKREDHEHPLKLFFSSPCKKGGHGEVMYFYCDVCQDMVEEGCWVYYCQECDFGTHLDCVMADREDTDEETEQLSEADSLHAAQLRLKQLQLQVQMNQRLAQMKVSMGQSLLNLV